MLRLTPLRWLLVIGCFAPVASMAQAPLNSTWVVTKSEWSLEDQQNWQNFIQALGRSGCQDLDACLKSSANPYRTNWDLQVNHESDCADFPYYLRAYFSYKNGLPFSMVNDIEANAPTAAQAAEIEKRKQQEESRGQLDKYLATLADERYSMNGNHPMTRFDVPSAKGAPRDFLRVAKLIKETISSGHFRMFQAQGAVLDDFYSPQITRTSIQPGTVLYKVTGHVAVVYDVTKDGEVKFMDAHPDNSVTRGTFGKDYPRSNPFHGGGFKNWRPFRLVEMDAKGIVYPVRREADGTIKSGQFWFSHEHDVGDYSAEQYFGNIPAANWDWKKGKFLIRGQEVNYFDFIKLRLTEGDGLIHPVNQFRSELQGLCRDLQERTRSVQAAVDAGLDRKEHPGVYPLNIYGSEGEWETYSTPGRDLRLRQKSIELVETLKNSVRQSLTGNPLYVRVSPAVKKDLLQAYHAVDASCRVSYVNSDQKLVRMSMTQALNRLTSMAFDPYLCVERRWGAQQPSELSSCRDNQQKQSWYQATQFLRNQTLRDPSEVMGYKLEDANKLNLERKALIPAVQQRDFILNSLKEL